MEGQALRNLGNLLINSLINSGDICKPGCVLGESLNVPVYQFLKEPLTRAYGEEFFASLQQVHKELENQNDSDK